MKLFSHPPFKVSPSPANRKQWQQLSAFTILELLVATTVSLLLITLLLGAVQGVSTGYTRIQSSITRMGDASFALDQLVQDLEGYVIPNFAQGEGIRVTPETVGPSSNATWLTLLTTATDADDSAPVEFAGATRAVSYRMAHQNPIDGSSSDPSFALYRSIASAKHTFDHNSTSTTNWQSQYWASIPASPSPAPKVPTDKDNFLAENVVAFSIRFQRKSDGTWTLPTDEVRIGRDGTTVNGTAVEGGFQRAEVSLTVINPDGALRLKSGLPLAETISKFGQTSVRQTSFF